LSNRKKQQHLTNKNNYNTSNNIEIRHIQQLLETRSTILLMDKKISLVMELKDDSKETFDEAIGLSTYFNSKAGVLSYISIFENLWKYTELYQKLEEANEQLMENEQLQKDFIHIAAHELRNPIQPILGVAEILKSIVNQNESGNPEDEVRISKNQFIEYMDLIIRNTKKLIRLTSDVLDLTRIETNSLNLHKETVDLRPFLRDHIIDYQKQKIGNTGIGSEYSINVNYNKKEENRARLEFSKLDKMDNYDSYQAEIDKSRISQVISNLLNNAFKFTNENDTIYIDLKKILLTIKNMLL
jgi:two-component system sensor histidine kinase VicK